jgi:hypothetical protein
LTTLKFKLDAARRSFSLVQLPVGRWLKLALSLTGDSRQNHLETALPQITSPNKVELSDDEQEHLALIHKGVNSARVINTLTCIEKATSP